MKKQSFRARVDADGRLLMAPDVKRAYGMGIAARAGKELRITVAIWKDQRSLAQNSRYWALLTVGAESLWGDKALAEQLHEDMAHLLLALPPDPKTGQRRREHTPDQDTAEFNDYMTRVEEKLIELGADLTEWDAVSERMAAA